MARPETLAVGCGEVGADGTLAAMLRRAWTILGVLAIGCSDSTGGTDGTQSGTAAMETSTSTSSEIPTTSASTTSATSDTTTTSSDTTADPSTSSESGGDGPRFDPAALMMFYNGCVPFGVLVDELVANGVLAGGDGSPWTCALIAGPGNGSFDFDDDPNTPDSFPPGMMLDPTTCEHYGPLDLPGPYGAHAWITTFTQNGTAVPVPFCGPQYPRVEGSYDALRQDAGAENSHFSPMRLFSPEYPFTFGTDQPDPKFTVHSPACEDTCFYNIAFTVAPLGADTVELAPQMQFPQDKFDGFMHALRITEDDPAVLQQYAGRPWVINVNFDYCIADNPEDCGNNEADPAVRDALVRQNGGGSTLQFSLVLLPFY